MVCASSVVLLLACGGSQQSSEPAVSPEAPVTEPEGSAPAVESTPPATVHVELHPKSGSQLSGTATLSETPEGVKVSLNIENVSPGEHGAHVHETGDCSAADGASAGGHFNPGAQPHALPVTNPRHLGDLGNISVGADGKGSIDIVAPGANLQPGNPNSFLGRAIIVHEKKDDGGQPTGNAGGRIGCGEVK